MADQDAAEGTPFGRYRLIELLGRGGMGEVWRAHDTVTDRVLAIKVLPANLSEDEDFQLRFRREAHAAARLDTPHVVPIYDYGEIDGRLFVSMRLIKGRDLQTVLAEGPLDPGRAVRIVGQVAEALNAAHDIGLIHRDIKPSNILLDDRDFAYLIDFGIARVADETRMTKAGNTIGTFAYIAPERLNPHIQEDARADIYSLACVLYEALTGKPPFAGSTTAHLIAAHLNTPPPQPSTTQPGVPRGVDEVIARGMAKDRDQRYATTIELADAARDAVTTPIPTPVAGRPTRPAVPPPPPPVAPQLVAVPTGAPTVWDGRVVPPPPLADDTPALPPESRSRRIPLAIGAGVVVALVATIALAFAVTDNGDSAGTGATSSTWLAPSSTSGGTTASTSAATAPPPSPPDTPQSRLLAMLSPNYPPGVCKPSSDPNATASAVCLEVLAAPADRPELGGLYWLYATREILTAEFQTWRDGYRPPHMKCPDGASTWTRPGAPPADAGSVACYGEDGIGIVEWTDPARLFRGFVEGRDLGRVYTWWQDHR